jgi:osmotically-inducible protein OsmY
VAGGVLSVVIIGCVIYLLTQSPAGGSNGGDNNEPTDNEPKDEPTDNEPKDNEPKDNEQSSTIIHQVTVEGKRCNLKNVNGKWFPYIVYETSYPDSNRQAIIRAELVNLSKLANQTAGAKVVSSVSAVNFGSGAVQYFVTLTAKAFGGSKTLRKDIKSLTELKDYRADPSKAKGDLIIYQSGDMRKFDSSGGVKLQEVSAWKGDAFCTRF